MQENNLGELLLILGSLHCSLHISLHARRYPDLILLISSSNPSLHLALHFLPPIESSKLWLTQ